MDDKLKQTISIGLSLLMVAVLPNDMLLGVVEAYGGVFMFLLILALPLGIFALMSGVKPRGVSGIALVFAGLATAFMITAVLRTAHSGAFNDMVFNLASLASALMIVAGLVIAIGFGEWGFAGKFGDGHGEHGAGHKKEPSTPAEKLAQSRADGAVKGHLSTLKTLNAALISRIKEAAGFGNQCIRNANAGAPMYPTPPGTAAGVARFPIMMGGFFAGLAAGTAITKPVIGQATAAAGNIIPFAYYDIEYAIYSRAMPPAGPGDVEGVLFIIKTMNDKLDDIEAEEGLNFISKSVEEELAKQVSELIESEDSFRIYSGKYMGWWAGGNANAAPDREMINVERRGRPKRW